jgi:CRISPR system Cascade subunit CasE
MYLSQLILNARNREVLRDLADPHQMHKTLTTRCFDGDCIVKQNNTPRAQAVEVNVPALLFRLDFDKEDNRPVVLMQSHLPPNLTGLSAGYALHIEGPKEVNLAGRLRVGQRFDFRLRANPTKREPARSPGERRDGARRPIYGQEKQIEWLVRKSALAGFSLPSHLKERDGEVVRVYDVDAYDEGNPSGPKTMSTRLGKLTPAQWVSVVFSGVLEVTDSQKFLTAVQYGIGTAKGMGFGLLSLSPLSHGRG